MSFRITLKASALALALVASAVAVPAEAAGRFEFRANVRNLVVDSSLTAPAPSAPSSSPLVLQMPEATLSTGVANQGYSYDMASLLVMTGGTPPPLSAVKFEAPTGLPLGFTLSTTGLLQGTPSAAGTYSFQVKASYTDKTALQTYSLSVLPPADPYYGNVTSLLHFEGLAGSSTFVDEKGLSWVATNALLSNSVVKFGGTSGYFSGVKTGEKYPHLATPGAPFALGSQAFTIEAFVRPTAASGPNHIVGSHIAGVNCDWLLYLNNGKLAFHWNANKDLTTAVAVPLNTWSHVAATRSGSTLRLYLNGALAGTATVSGSIGSGTGNPVTVGADARGTGAPFNGHIDDLRVTQGTDRYPGSFSAPVATFVSY